MRFSRKSFLIIFFFAITFASSAFAASSWQEIKDLGFVPGDKSWATKHNAERDELYNTLSVSINPDGTLKSNVNASQWITGPTAVTYVAASSFKVADAEGSVFVVGRKVWVNQTIDVIGVVASTSSSGGFTTVTLSSIVLYSDNSTSSTVTTPITSVSVGIDTLRSDPSPKNTGRGAYSNLVVKRVSVSTVTVTADSITLSSSTATYDALSVSLTCDMTTDLDSGLTEGANTFYSIWVSSGGTTETCIIGDITATPMDAGTYIRRVGWVGNDASGNLVSTKQMGDTVWFTARQTAASGLAATAYTTQDISAVVPSASGQVREVLFGGISTGATANVNIFLSDGGANAKTIFRANNANTTIGSQDELYGVISASPVFIPANGNNIFYKISADSVSLLIRAYRINF